MTLSFYLQPLDLGAPEDLPPASPPLAGGPCHFARLAVTWRDGGAIVAREQLRPADLADALAAAQYYPAVSWFSLIEVPEKNEFPGTGPEGNGISPNVPRSASSVFGQVPSRCG